MKKETAFGIGIGLIIIDMLQRSNDTPKVFVMSEDVNYNARTIPPIGIFVKESQLGNKNLIDHEMIHWQQYQRYGTIGFYLRYLLGGLNGYDANPMEIEAREIESDYCKNNYTECVRKGIALTVSDPNFRK